MCAAASQAKARALPEVNAQRCTGCGRCVATCDPHALSLETQAWQKTAVLHAPQACTGCSDCARICPFRAIRMVKAPGVATA
jgi:ferredoxin